MPFKSFGDIKVFSFDIFDNQPDLNCFMSTSYNDFNLGSSGEADLEEIKSNRQKFLQTVGSNPELTAIGKQIHSANVRSVSSGGTYADTDGFVTNTKGVSLIISAADCLPIFLYDPANKVIGAVHSGRVGTQKNITNEVVDKMRREFNTDPADIVAAIGPAIETDCYEVGADAIGGLNDEFVTPIAGDKYLLDLKGAVKDQMISAGIAEGNIEVSEICTKCDEENFYSYRREGVSSGRMWGVIRLAK